MSTMVAIETPEVGNRVAYTTGDSAKRTFGVVTQIFANGRMRVEFQDGTWKSLPHRFQKRVASKQYGLLLAE